MRGAWPRLPGDSASLILFFFFNVFIYTAMLGLSRDSQGL